jgi:hypothetical protein
MLQITQNSNSHFAPQTFGHQQHGGIVDGIVEVRPPMQHSFSQTSYPQTSDFGMITEDYNYFSSFDGLTNFQGGLPHVR